MMRLLLLSVCLGITLLGYAQQENMIDSDFLTEADLLSEELGLDDNVVRIDQVGNNNEVAIVTRQQALESNFTRIKQEGSDNFAEVFQSGGNNQVILLQKGNENEFRLDLSGTSNDIAVVQHGNQNEIIQRLSNARDLNFEYIQRGDGNLIEHEADGLVSKDIKVLQSGNNMEVIINQSSIALPPARQ